LRACVLVDQGARESFEARLVSAFLDRIGLPSVSMARVRVRARYKLEQINEACDALARGEIAGRAIVEF
jgi:hypothetical protein